MKRLLLSTLLFLSALLYARRPAQAPVPAPTPVAATAPASEDVRQILADRIDTYKKSVGIVVGAISPQGTKVYSYGRLASDSQTVPSISAFTSKARAMRSSIGPCIPGSRPRPISSQ